MKSKLRILYETVYTFVQCWYDGEPQFLERATTIQFLPKRVAFVLAELVRATSGDPLPEALPKPRRAPPMISDSPAPAEVPDDTARETITDGDGIVVHEAPAAPSPVVSPNITRICSPRTHMPTDVDNYIQMAHQSVQKLSLIALGHMINSDARNVTVTSLTETVRTLTLTLCAQERTPKNSTSCPVS